MLALISSIFFIIVSFLWDFAKIWLTVAAAYGAYILYGLKKGFIVISR